MKIKYLLAASVVSLTAATGMIAAPAAAQQIVTGVEGSVLDEAGNPLPGATVTVTDTRTGQSRELTAGNDGQFRVDSLVTGGPYTVTATAPGFEGQTVNEVNLTLQGNTQFVFELTNAAVGTENTIVVTGARANVSRLAVGPGQSFGEATIEAFPSISRDIRDIIRIDPRVSLDRSNEVDRVSCLGGNDRTNAFTVDGISQSDLFGLNGTPFASRNSLPLPYDAVRETSVEFAPFDVQYGQFTGCAINVVTQSGQNDFHGSAFFTYTSDSLQGETADGVDFSASPYKEKRWGATLGGPIIPDRLFFFGAYEETDLGDSFQFGPAGEGFPNEVNFVTTEQFNQFSQILGDTYGIEAGGLPRNLAESSKRYFGRIDAYITDDHRLEATYQRLEEENVESDDFSNNSNIFTGLNSFEQEGTESDYYSLRLYSTWSDMFSTELRASRAIVQDVQGPVGGGEAQSDNPIPRIVVGVQNGGLFGSLVAGPGFSRASNDLKTTVTQVKALGRINADAHQITIGAEWNELDVFNLFAQNSTGTLTFANLDDFAAGLISGGTNTFPGGEQIANGEGAGAYGNFTATGDINDAAANWKRTTWVGYVQDDWQLSSQLSVIGGVRVEWLSGDAPDANPAFFDRYGFTNSIGFGKIDPVVLPRLGFTYDLYNDGFFTNTQVKGGIGRFTGGDPAVYFSNAFSNNGFAVGFGQTGVANCVPEGTQADVVTGGTFTGIPSCVVANAAAQSAGGRADTQSTSPDFKQPTVWRANFGFSTDFGVGNGFLSDWNLTADFIYSRFDNPVDFVDLSQVPDTRRPGGAFTVDGRPIYRAIDPSVAGCTATLLNQGGRPPVYTNVNAACFNTGRDDEIQLVNGESFDSKIASVILSKQIGSGVFTGERGNILFNFGYAYTDAENNRYSNSSTATSSFDIVAAADRQLVTPARSEFSSKHNITAAVNFREQFFADYDTSFGLIFIARSGRPYSIVFDNGPSSVLNDSASGDFNSLLYVPTGINDPNLAPTSNAGAVAALDEYISNTPCLNDFRGQTVERNSCENSWFYDLDLRFSQDIPGPASAFGLRNDRLKLFVDVDNFLNLIDSDANVLKTYGYTEAVVRADIDAQGRYVYTNFTGPRDPLVQSSSSLWRVQLGVSYEF